MCLSMRPTSTMPTNGAGSTRDLASRRGHCELKRFVLSLTCDAADSVQLSSSSFWQVWQDALDLTQSGGTGEVKCLFHYTTQVGFRNITAPSKKAVEVFVLDSVTTHHVVCPPPTHPRHKLLDDPKASLVTEGPKANAWWGQGKFSISPPPTMGSSQRAEHGRIVELVRAPFATTQTFVYFLRWTVSLQHICPPLAFLTRRLHRPKSSA